MHKRYLSSSCIADCARRPPTRHLMIVEPVADVLARLRDLPAEILADTAGRYAGRVAFATSLGVDDQVVTHMLAKGGLGIPIFTVDTCRLFPETYELIDRTEPTLRRPHRACTARTRRRSSSWSRATASTSSAPMAFLRLQCCETRKARPLRRAQVGLDAWICGRHGGRDARLARSSRQAWDSSAGLPEAQPSRGAGTPRACGTTSARTTSPTTPCTTRAANASTARPARSPGPPTPRRPDGTRYP